MYSVTRAFAALESMPRPEGEGIFTGWLRTETTILISGGAVQTVNHAKPWWSAAARSVAAGWQSIIIIYIRLLTIGYDLCGYDVDDDSQASFGLKRWGQY